MQRHAFGRLSPVSALTLGGGGIGMVWGETNFAECVATVHAAVEAGVDLIDLAPSYGGGKAEAVVGETFGGRLPAGVRVTSKCGLGEPPSAEIEPMLRRSIEGSLARLRLSRLDLFFLHSNVVPDAGHRARRPEAASRMTLYATFGDRVRPVFERLVGESRRLAIHCTAAGAGPSPSRRMIVSGWPMPVSPQAPIRPSATRRSKSGRICATKVA